MISKNSHHEAHEGSDGLPTDIPRAKTAKVAKELIPTGENRGNEVFEIVSVISVTSCKNSILFPSYPFAPLACFAREFFFRDLRTSW